MTKRLYRSRKFKVFAGVAGGLGEYFDTDPVFVRIVFVATTVLGGFGLLAYILCWIIIPQEPLMFPMNPTEQQQPAPSQKPEPNNETMRRRQGGGIMAGVVLIVLGVLFLADNFLPYFDFGDLWPLLLVAIGAVMLWRAFSKS